MPLMGSTIETREDLFLHELGSTLTMERTILDMLEELQEKAMHDKLKAELGHHHDETERHVQNIESAFRALDAEVDDSPCPAIEGLEKEGESNLKKVDDSLNDAVILGGVAETEHHEIAVYEGLITQARAMGKDEVVRLLEQNLRDEQAMLAKGKQMHEQVARGMAPVPAAS